MVKIGLIGFGTVGVGVLKILQKNRALIERKIGTKINIARICDIDITTLRDVKVPRNILTMDANDILNDPGIDIVVELIGSENISRKIVFDAIGNQKHVVTANKTILSKYWTELISFAGKNKVLIYFEASVAGGIPVIQALNEGLAANRIQSILGILNGTTNYILTRMSKDTLTFKAALAEAKKAGFAEADPRLDIEGNDTAQKLSILSSIAFNAWVDPQKIYCEGISGISSKDIVYAQEQFGYVIKLLAIAKNIKNRIEVRVHPTLISHEHQLASVDDEFNAVYITGDAVGETMYYGKGAGQLPAASAVVSDIIYVARHIYNGTAGKFEYVTCDKQRKLDIISSEDIQSKYYVRFSTVDRPGVLSKISGILGKHGVSIASCYQKEWATTKVVPIIMVTHEAREGDIQKALSEIDKLSISKSKSILIRIEE